MNISRLKTSNCSFLSAVCRLPWVTQTSWIQLFPMPPDYKDIELPNLEDRKLPILEKAPTTFPFKHPKIMKRLIDIRGPELVNNQLIHKQFGIIALCGGYFRHEHIELIRNAINRKIEVEKTFAVWRLDPPWKPVTKKGKGKRMGGGKGAIDHYVTPVKAGRIIIEVGGKIEYEEVRHILEGLAGILPVDAMAINQEILENLLKEEKEIAESNINPFTYQYVIENNMQGCHRWASPYEHRWFGKYI